jgi:hypothetical protein
MLSDFMVTMKHSLTYLAEASAFSDAEKAILTTAIQAFSTAILASDAPLTVLLAGLKTIGVNALTDAANNLEAQINAFAGFASKVNFITA